MSEIYIDAIAIFSFAWVLVFTVLMVFTEDKRKSYVFAALVVLGLVTSVVTYYEGMSDEYFTINDISITNIEDKEFK